MAANPETIYARLCVDLGRTAEKIPQGVADYMRGRIDAARERLAEDGVDVEAGGAAMEDLWVMYAAYLYRRRDSNEGMPRSLRLALNDAKVSAAIRRNG